MRAALLIALALLGAGCRRHESPPPAPLPPAPLPAAPLAPPPPPTAPANVVAPPGDESREAEGAALVAEERDPDPRSRTVTIKLVADGRRKARVFWGRKDLGEAPLELTRPRDSGPLDLLVVAPGCLPLHTRVFTDRDDRLFLRLFPLDQASQLLGYAPPAADHPARHGP